MAATPQQTQDLAPMQKVHTPGKNSTLRTAPSVQHAVVAQRTLGKSKRSISRALGIARGTVDAILAQSQTRPDFTGRVEQIIPKAFNAIETQLDKGDGSLGMRFIEYAVPSPSGNRISVQGDATFQTLVQLAPAPAPPPQAPTQAAANPGGDQVGLGNPAQFSVPAQFLPGEVVDEKT